MGINGLLEFSTVIGAILFLLPLFMGCVLFFLVIWMIIRNKRNETNKRVEVALAAIEKNPGIDVEELLKKEAKVPEGEAGQQTAVGHYDIVGRTCLHWIRSIYRL